MLMESISTLEDFKAIFSTNTTEEICLVARKQGLDLVESKFFNYLEIYYCGNHKAVFYIASLLFLIALFYAMCRYCDFHLTRSLTAVSRYMKLRPEVAGVTFLAFGNGCPDFFTAFAGIDDSIDLVIGSSTGTCIFIMSFVLGLVLLLAKGNNGSSQKAIIHDPLENGTSGLEKQDYPVTVLQYNNLNVSNYRVLFRNLVTLLLAVVCLFALIFLPEIGIYVPALFLSLFCIHVFITIYSQVRKPESHDASEEVDNGVTNDDDDDGGKEISSNETILDKFLYFIEWDNLCVWERILLVLKLPVDICGYLTIPPMYSGEPDEKRHSFINQILWVLNPIFSVLFITFSVGPGMLHDVNGHGFQLWALSLCIGVTLSSGSYFFRHERLQGLLVPLGFAICIVWMYLLSQELVAILSVLGLIFDIKDVILGVIVLALGNAAGDIVSNIAVTKSVDGFEAALYSCITSPIQNIWLSLGVSLIKEIAKGEKLSVTKNQNELMMSMIILIVLLLFLCIWVYMRKPFSKAMGIILITIYPLYVGSFLLTSFLSSEKIK